MKPTHVYACTTNTVWRNPCVGDFIDARRLVMRRLCIRSSRHNAADRYQHEYRSEDNRKRNVGESHDVPPWCHSMTSSASASKLSERWTRFSFLCAVLSYAATA